MFSMDRHRVESLNFLVKAVTDLPADPMGPDEVGPFKH